MKADIITWSWVKQDSYEHIFKVSRWIILKWLIKGKGRIVWQVPTTSKRKGLYIKGNKCQNH